MDETTAFLSDPDLRLYCGPALEVLRGLPDASVDCCVTSPPYWGLRDYGTGQWDGGDPDCDHRHETAHQKQGASSQRAGRTNTDEQRNENFRDVCGKCGAVRVDRQLGLEKTPQEYVANLVAVFREVRRVLAPHGTVWLNLGDSYASSPPGNKGSGLEKRASSGLHGAVTSERYAATLDASVSQKMNTVVGGLKPKDLVGIPWRVAFGLQDDGWYLRSDIIWAKPNPMPESVTDRPTKSHEYVFLLSKGPRYFFDQEAVREAYTQSTIERDAYGYHHAFGNQFKGSPTDERHPDGKQLAPGSFTGRGPDGRRKTTVQGSDGSIQHRDGERWPNGGRNIRSVWEIATQPYPEAHFATFPEELPRRAIKAGCPEQVCRVCGKPRERVVEVESSWRSRAENGAIRGNLAPEGLIGAGTQQAVHGAGVSHDLDSRRREMVGWTDCDHGDYRPGVVLDPFAGAGTTALVARKLGRHAVGIELNPDYCALIANGLQQLSLLA